VFTGGPFSMFKRSRPRREEILGALQPPGYRRIRLERFPRGIDNVRVDVLLDPKFVSAATNLVAAVLREDVQRYFWDQAVKAPNVEVTDVFRAAYRELSQSVTNQAKLLARPERVQLFQLAVFKLLLMLVDKEMEALREELMDARAHPARQQSGQSLRLHERSVILSRFAREIRFRTLRDVLQLVMRLEHASLRKMRKTIMGISWPLSEQMLNAPAVQLGGRGSAEDFVKFFPYLLYDETTATAMLGQIFAALQDWLPDDVEVPVKARKAPFKEDRSRGEVVGAPGLIETERCVFGLVGEKERMSGMPHAFDDAHAVRELFGGKQAQWPDPGRWGEKRFAVEFKRRYASLFQRLRKAGLLNPIQASYLLQQIYPALGISHFVEPVYAYLLGETSRRELLKRLQARPEIEEPEAVLARIEELVKTHKALSGRQRRDVILQCVQDAVAYRFQFKLGWWMLNGMEDVHLLSDPREQEMSRANNLLQSFEIGAPEGAGSELPPAGHVIIKADIRGSTRITATMRERNLNPAAYFSRNFYDPITALLRDYGADKVFVEGDAVILAVIERAGETREQLAVARACGLAQRMLEVVDRENAQSRRMQLPRLEVGIGIAYCNEAPAYLFDEGHKIMISPAINRADRLSSCDSALRSVLQERGMRRGVEVVDRVASHREESREGAMTLHFNVNGIELEAAAFYQLASVLKLHRLRMPGHEGLFHAGRYPDLRGHTHWLIIREAPVRSMLGSQILEARDDGRHFHQVVTEKGVREAIKKRLAGKR